MTTVHLIVLSVLIASSLSQRPSYAGNRAIGYPELSTTPLSNDGLGNRFGNEATERLPIEALGNRDLVNRLSRLPIDKQPFWFINWRILEQSRQTPQTYPQRPNPFIDPIPTNQLNQNQQFKNRRNTF